MITLLLLLASVVAIVSVLMPLLFVVQVYRARGGTRQVTCPETHDRATVRMDALHCASSALQGTEYLRLSTCSRWPEKKDCDQDCVYELFEEQHAERSQAVARVRHAAVLVGAGLAWLLGAVWYADPVFGRTWMRLNGLSEAAARTRAELVTPYLVPLAGFVVLGYCLAWMARRSGRSLATKDVGIAMLLCAAFLLVTSVLHRVLPGSWLHLTWVDAAYAMAGSVVTALVVGAWPKLASIGLADAAE